MLERVKTALGWGKSSPDAEPSGSAAGRPPAGGWPRQHPHVELNTSALTCHLGFFLPLVANDTLQERLDAINYILTTIHTRYGSTHHLAPLAGDNPVSVIELQWRSLRVRLRFSLHTEEQKYR
jgi:hypothetical protein